MSRSEVFKPLHEQQQQLVEAWKRIRQYFPAINESERDLTEVPSAGTLHKAVTDAEAVWKRQGQGIWNKTSQQFLDFVGIMNDHSYLFKFIPAGDKYVSLIAGVVTTIVKASHLLFHYCNSPTSCPPLRMMNVPVDKTPRFQLITRRLLTDFPLPFLILILGWTPSGGSCKTSTIQGK